MTADTQVIKKWVQNLSLEAIKPNDPLHIDLSARTGEEQDWVAPFLDMIDIKGGSSCQLFSGYIGTGKSTILLEMQTRLETEGYVVLRADASRYHDLQHPITPTEMIIILAAAIGDKAGERLGKNLRRESYFTRLQNFMQTEIKLTNIRFPIDALNMQGAFKDPKTPFSQTVRDHFSDNLTGLKEDCHEYIRECAGLLKKHIHDCKGVVFILDSLERLKNGVGYEFDDVMSSIIQILSSHGDLLRCQHIHAIYTVPPYLGLFRDDIHFEYDTLQSEPLPVVKVQNRDYSEFLPGICTLARLLDKRVSIRDVFGVEAETIKAHKPEDCESWRLLKQVIIQSGGHIRRLLKLTHDLVMNNFRKGLPLTKEQIEPVLNRARNKAEGIIIPADIPLLHKIMETQTTKGLDPDERSRLAHHVENFTVMHYQNGDSWVNVHPMVQSYVRKQFKSLEEKS